MTQTQEDKELLLKDLCARLPYGVLVHIRYKEGEPCYGKLTSRDIQWFIDSKIENIKPYLRPMSSITKEEKSELKDITNEFGDNWFEATTPEERWKCTFLNSSNQIDWLNAHHFDYRNLIGLGLALEATADMYNLNK